MSNLLPLFIIATFVASSLGTLEDQVTYYELLDSNNVHTRSKRSVNSGDASNIGYEMSLKLFNLTLMCHLHPRKDLFSSSFRLVVNYGDKEDIVNDFDKDQFLIGTCEGDANSDVHGYFSSDVFQGTISYKGVVYGIEAAYRHIKERNAGELRGKMIAYRSSDMIWEQNEKGKGPSFCGAKHADGEDKRHTHDEKGSQNSKGAHQRSKRASKPFSWSTCRLIAVADYKFYRFIGNRDIYTTAAYIGSLMETVDAIYRRTVFNVDYDITGMGFEIAKMQINVNPTSGYNADQANWDSLQLLQAFGQNTNFQDYCLAHLFTHQQFTGNVLGLAYIAPDSWESAGGICSSTRIIEEVETALNTGWTTTLNSNGDTVLAQQAQLVTAHELGHNWGAEHDPDTDSCAPSSLLGDGKYLMYAYSVNGYDSNNDDFSPCSISDIGKVLKIKARECFTETPNEDTTCGNGLIDPEEQCDAGYLGRFGLDPCCTSQCQLTEGATCSGASFDCPNPPNKPQGSSCLDLGQCDGNGVCESFCKARGKETCTCDEVSESCQRCCRDNATSECKPYDNNHPLPNSRPCVVGYCMNGKCLKSENSAIQRLFDILDDLSIDGVLAFFRNNLVGCIMVFTLIIWIPLSCFISFKDWRYRQNLKRQVKVDLREDREFLYDEDGRKIARPQEPLSSTPRTPRSMVPRRLPPLMSPRNKELVHNRNRIMPVGGEPGINIH